MSKTFSDLRDALAGLPIAIPPDPWARITTESVDGLTAIGFAANTELLLVVSEGGRSVFDLDTGGLIARDPEPYFEDELKLRAEGIGPLDDHVVSVAGRFGGGLPLHTEDGWTMMSVYLEWPVPVLFLLPPDVELSESVIDERFFKLAEDPTIRAFGFSDSGKSMVIATSSDVTFWTRVN